LPIESIENQVKRTNRNIGMKPSYHTIKVNFRGGIIAPAEFFNILLAAKKALVTRLSFGLRQQLLMEIHTEDYPTLKSALDRMQVPYETDTDRHPNIISSYPAENVFIGGNWLGDAVYNDLFKALDYQPRLKINISNNNQSFTPFLTGNINWVAAQAPHAWHLFIRFPKTNTIYEWNRTVSTDDVPRMSRHIEQIILDNPEQFYDRPDADGEQLFKLVQTESYDTKPAAGKAVLPAFSLPYYEGLNRYNDQYWLGIYRREAEFTFPLLLDICRLCLDTKGSQICSTPWKTLIVKGISEQDRSKWIRLLSKHLVNTRHAANELNFQVEDNSPDALALKNYLVKGLNRNDIRTFGLCLGIKTKRKTEVFSSILIKRRPLLRVGAAELFFRYDILIAKDFNPNERTSTIFADGIPRFLLPEQLRRAILSFYKQLPEGASDRSEQDAPRPAAQVSGLPAKTIYQCPKCRSLYNESAGDPARHIAPGTAFEALPAHASCALCDQPLGQYVPLEQDLFWDGK
jgi:rubredoxin